MVTTAVSPSLKERRPRNGMLRLGLFWPYGQTTHVISRALADRNPDALDRRVQLDLARATEEAGFDFVFIADAWFAPAGPFGHKTPLYDPCTLAAGLSTVTEHLGFVTTIQTILHQPAQIARLGGTLDRWTGGRWAWNMVTASHPEGEGLFGVGGIDHDTRYAMQAEMVEAVKRLWSADQNEIVDFQGEFYRFRGALVDPRPLQRPHPLLLTAATSEVGQRLAAANCDYLFVNTGNDIPALEAITERVRRYGVEAGRDADATGVLVSPIAFLGDTQQAAEAAYEWFLDHLDLEGARRFLQSSHRLPPGAAAREADVPAERLRAVAMGTGHLHLVGSPATVADEIVRWCRSGALSGLLVSLPFWSPDETRRFAAVTDCLREAGVWEPPAAHGWSW